VNIILGTLTRHGGGVICKAVHLPVVGSTLDEEAHLELGAGTGTKIGTAVSQRRGFYGATPVIQRSDAVQAG